jgi:hypothetical protein
MRSVTELIARFLRSLRMISSRVLVLASFLTARFARGDDADRFFMADHMYYKKKSFAFGITDGGLAVNQAPILSVWWQTGWSGIPGDCTRNA